MSTKNLQRSPAPEEIAVRAYLIWEGRGRPDGQDIECWLRAEEELKALPSPPARKGGAKAARTGRQGKKR